MKRENLHNSKWYSQQIAMNQDSLCLDTFANTVTGEPKNIS